MVQKSTMSFANEVQIEKGWKQGEDLLLKFWDGDPSLNIWPVIYDQWIETAKQIESHLKNEMHLKWKEEEFKIDIT